MHGGGSLTVRDVIELLKELRPSIVLVGDAVVRDIGADTASNLAEWTRHFNGDLTATEDMVNHAHLGDIVLSTWGAGYTLEPSDWRLLLSLYVDVLESHLRRLLPAADFEIVVSNEDQIAVDPGECTITFHRKR